MDHIPRSSRLFIFFGDVILLYVALVAALWIRYPRGISREIVEVHILPFSILFVLWITVFLIAGLYKKHLSVRKNRLPSTILRVQIINSVLAVIFFYSTTYFGIAPKTTLFIYLLVSFFMITLWRMYGPILLGNRADLAIFITAGGESNELTEELRRYKGYPIAVAQVIDLEKETDVVGALKAAVANNPEASILVSDLDDVRMNPALQYVYELVSRGYAYFSIHSVYEEVFQRLPVSLLDDRWLIEHMSLFPGRAYDILKRTVDIVAGTLAFIISLPFYIIAFILIKLDDGGPLYFVHERVGQKNRPIRIVKFRSMSVHDEKDGLAKEKKLTRVGTFLRKSRIDELPQLWNVIKGDLSLIGPRSELPKLVAVYEKEIPYYALRHSVKPGLSGWAQINQKTPPKFFADSELTKQKVSYDLYYIQHRSFMLDMLIVLQTIRELVSSRGI